MTLVKSSRHHLMFTVSCLTFTHAFFLFSYFFPQPCLSLLRFGVNKGTMVSRVIVAVLPLNTFKLRNARYSLGTVYCYGLYCCNEPVQNEALHVYSSRYGISCSAGTSNSSLHAQV